MQASQFEELRKMHGTDEILAWEEYRRTNKGMHLRVISPAKYDERTLQSKENPRVSPGQDWTYRLVKKRGRNFVHWMSPIRCIEFMRYKEACKFEELRKIHSNDEVVAWNELRRSLGKICVVSHSKYDGAEQQGSEGKSPRPDNEDLSDNRLAKRRKVGNGRQGMSSLLLALDPSNDNSDDNARGGLVGRSPPESVAPVASATKKPPVAKYNDDIATSHPSSDDEEINAWIWRSSRKGKTSTANTTTASAAGIQREMGTFCEQGKK